MRSTTAVLNIVFVCFIVFEVSLSSRDVLLTYSNALIQLELKDVASRTNVDNFKEVFGNETSKLYLRALAVNEISSDEREIFVGSSHEREFSKIYYWKQTKNRQNEISQLILSNDKTITIQAMTYDSYAKILYIVQLRLNGIVKVVGVEVGQFFDGKEEKFADFMVIEKNHSLIHSLAADSSNRVLYYSWFSVNGNETVCEIKRRSLVDNWSELTANYNASQLVHHYKCPNYPSVQITIDEQYVYFIRDYAELIRVPRSLQGGPTVIQKPKPKKNFFYFQFAILQRGENLDVLYVTTEKVGQGNTTFNITRCVGSGDPFSCAGISFHDTSDGNKTVPRTLDQYGEIQSPYLLTYTAQQVTNRSQIKQEMKETYAVDERTRIINVTKIGETSVSLSLLYDIENIIAVEVVQGRCDDLTITCNRTTDFLSKQPVNIELGPCFDHEVRHTFIQGYVYSLENKKKGKKLGDQIDISTCGPPKLPQNFTTSSGTVTLTTSTTSTASTTSTSFPTTTTSTNASPTDFKTTENQYPRTTDASVIKESTTVPIAVAAQEISGDSWQGLQKQIAGVAMIPLISVGFLLVVMICSMVFLVSVAKYQCQDFFTLNSNGSSPPTGGYINLQQTPVMEHPSRNLSVNINTYNDDADLGENRNSKFSTRSGYFDLSDAMVQDVNEPVRILTTSVPCDNGREPTEHLHRNYFGDIDDNNHGRVDASNDGMGFEPDSSTRKASLVTPVTSGHLAHEDDASDELISIGHLEKIEALEVQHAQTSSL